MDKDDYDLLKDIVLIELCLEYAKKDNKYLKHLEPVINYGGCNKYLLDLKERVLTLKCSC